MSPQHLTDHRTTGYGTGEGHAASAQCGGREVPGDGRLKPVVHVTVLKAQYLRTELWKETQYLSTVLEHSTRAQYLGTVLEHST
jgi:hypothetical protein